MLGGNEPIWWKRPSILWWLLSVIIAFSLGRVQWPSERFGWDPKIPPVQVLTLVTTILVSAAFFRSIERQKYIDKLRKDALIDALQAVGKKLQELQASSEGTSPEYTEVVTAIRQLRGEFTVLVRLAVALGRPVSDLPRKEFLRTWAELNRLLTYTPSLTDPKTPNDLRIENGKLRLTARRRVEAGLTVEAMRRLLLELRARIILTV